MITYTNIVKIRFIVPAISVEDGLKQGEITFQIGVNLKKWTLKYLTMNRISDIIISERGRYDVHKRQLNEFVAKD